MPYIKIRDWISLVNLLFVKTLKPTMVDKKIDDKEAMEFQKFLIIILIKEEEFWKILNLK